MKIVIFLCIFLFSFFTFARFVFAVEDPRSVPNNKIGIHILFPDEIENAAQLVNSNGGEWGYVIIPIQAGEKDIEKWQKFMDSAKKHKIVPIIRLATEGDYFNTRVWRKPNFADVLDFANFLNSLQWPTKNRYISVFNEVNRGDEWGGATNAAEYAHILSYAVTAFKSLSSDFFILSAGLDNAAPSQGTTYQNQYDFLADMAVEIPDIFSRIDGISSHSYPNPGFSQPPSYPQRNNVYSFRFEKNLISSLSNKDLPVFITETGWDNTVVNRDTIAQYYSIVFSSVWNDSDIIAVTPFLLRAGLPFAQFSFISADGSQSNSYKSIYDLPKTKGEPKLALVPAPKPIPDRPKQNPTLNFTNIQFPVSYDVIIPKGMIMWLKWLKIW